MRRCVVSGINVRDAVVGDAEEVALVHHSTWRHSDADLLIEAAHCWVELGQPDRALGVLQQGLMQWRPEFRRDLGLGLARFAVAHARTGAVDDALNLRR
jgi:hypothetical protein